MEIKSRVLADMEVSGSLKFTGGEIWRECVSTSQLFGHLHEVQLNFDVMQTYAVRAVLVFASCVGPVLLTTALSGLLASLAALLHVALVNQGSHIDGSGYELNAIAAVVIGGTRLSGGAGTVLGSMLGALILSILDNILGLRNIQPYNNSNIYQFIQEIFKSFIRMI